MEIAVLLKHLRIFLRTLQMLLKKCEINLMLAWSGNCVICKGDRATAFVVTDTKLYVPVVTLLTQDNKKLLEQLKVRERKTGTNISQKYQLWSKINIIFFQRKKKKTTIP